MMDDMGLLRLGAVALPFVVLLITGRSALGQANLASLTGVVVDSAEASIPEARVVVRNIHTGIETPAETNAAGYCTVLNLAPG